MTTAETNMKLPHTDTYELLDNTGHILNHPTNYHSPPQNGFHLPPRPLHRYRRLTWRNGITVLLALGFASACLTGLVFGGVFTSYNGGDSVKYSVNTGVCTLREVWALNLVTNRIMSFRQVKILDAAINLIFGRGFQIFCSWLSYQVFGMATLRILQDNKVPVPFLCAIAFQPVSLRAFYYQLRTVLVLRTPRAKIITIWLAVSIMYLLFMPVLLDLMTGYIAVYDTHINIPSDDSTTVLKEFNDTIQCCFAALWRDQHHLGGEDTCDFGTNNICPSSLPYYGGYNFTVDDLIGTDGRWLANTTAKTNVSYFLQCAPSAQYSWGISTGWCLVLSSITLLWGIGMCSIWFDTMRFGYIWHSGRGFGEYRNLLDIAHHLDHSLGPDTCAYADRELQRAINNLPPVGFEVVSDGVNSMIKLSEHPGGHEHLHATGTIFGGMARLRNRLSDHWSAETQSLTAYTAYKSNHDINP